MDWDRVGELVLDPDDVPDDVLLRGLTTQDGRLIAFGPGAPVRVSLEAWRLGVRVQQVAFELAKVLARKWQEDRGDAIPAHRLFPQMLDAASHFIEEHVTPVKTRTRQDLAINPYFGKAVAMIVNAMESVDGGGASQERAVFAPGAAGTRSTRMVNFHTGKPLHDVLRCHLNAAVFDSDWERQAADLLGSHPAVAAWVKNDRLGLVIPYRKEGTPRKLSLIHILLGHGADRLPQRDDPRQIAGAEPRARRVVALSHPRTGARAPNDRTAPRRGVRDQLAQPRAARDARCLLYTSRCV